MIFGITGNTTKSMIQQVVPELLDWLHRNGVDYIVDVNLLQQIRAPISATSERLHQMGDKCDVMLALGGDGTILTTAQAVGASGVPILGVNLGGRLGFLAEVMMEELYDSLANILDNDYSILERLVLEAKVDQQGGNGHYFALNDVVIDRGGYSRVITVDVFIDQEYLNTYVGDGVIIATPTGSTAYSLSAMGPILIPTVDCMVINPICPHSLSVRPVVISDDCCIRIVPHVDRNVIMLSVDGDVKQHFAIQGQAIEVKVQKAGYKIRWIRHKKRSFYDLLRTKLNWGFDKRTRG